MCSQKEKKKKKKKKKKKETRGVENGVAGNEQFA